MFPYFNAVIASAASLAQMDVIIKRKPLIDSLSEEGEKPVGRPFGNIEVKNVYFSYPSRPDNQVCNDYNLSVASGETVALCGPSGAGKSTIINLLLRFYDPSSGQILLDGMDIRSLNIRWLRSVIGYVGQEPVLFSGTIFENISYGFDKRVFSVDSVSDDVVIAAATLANAHDFITSFPNGYNTDVGSNGTALSGGQKQRIAIARALVKRPAVLLLDEATSALDNASEKLVQASIDQLQQSRMQTTLVIAHRLSTIRNADKIAVVNGGRVVELGKHDELLAKDGLYADLVRVQLGGDEASTSAKLNAMESAVAAVVEAVAVIYAEDVELSSFTKTAFEEDAKKSRNNEPNKQAGKVEKEKSAPVAAVEEAPLSKEESRRVSRRIWGMVAKYPGWVLLGFFGALCFGGAFPVWGYYLAKAQAMYFVESTHVLRVKAIGTAVAFIVLGVVTIGGATLQFWCIGRVRKW